MTTSKLQQRRRELDPKNIGPGTSIGTSNSNTQDPKGTPIDISSSPEKIIKEKEEERGETQIKNMIKGTHKKGIIPRNL